MATLRLVFVTKADPDSGNFNTAQRICKQLVTKRPTWHYKIISVTASDSFDWPQTVDDLLSADVLLCLHVYRCADIVRRASNGMGKHLPPMIGIAGGTDLNVDSRDPEKLTAMREFVRQCRHAVVFSRSMQCALTELMQGNADGTPVTIIPQGIACPLLQPREAGDGACRHQRYFIILGRIRQVKNCCSVLEPFIRWSSCQGAAGHGCTDPVRLLFVGDIEDSDYGEKFKLEISRLSGVDLLRGVHHLRALELMRNSLGLINCSLSEGQSNSILEAMSLGIPVIVSSISGNLDIVEHMNTGLTFEDDEQLIHCIDIVASQDLPNRQLVQRITDSARAYVIEKHSLGSESDAYVSLITDCCCSNGNA